MERGEDFLPHDTDTKHGYAAVSGLDNAVASATDDEENDVTSDSPTSSGAEVAEAPGDHDKQRPASLVNDDEPDSTRTSSSTTTTYLGPQQRAKNLLNLCTTRKSGSRSDQRSAVNRYFETLTPMDIVEKLGALANLKTHGGYNGYSLEYMLWPLFRVLNQKYFRRFPDRIWETRGYETFLVHGSDRYPKGVVRFGIPDVFQLSSPTEQHLQRVDDQDHPSSVVAESSSSTAARPEDSERPPATKAQNKNFTAVTVTEVTNFLSTMIREKVIRIPDRDASNIWFRRGNPSNDLIASRTGRPIEDFPFVSNLSGIIQDEDSVEFYHRQTWRKAFAEEVDREKERLGATGDHGVLRSEGEDLQGRDQVNELQAPDDLQSSTPSISSSSRFAVEHEQDDKLPFDPYHVFPVNPVKEFSNTIVVMASEWQNISHFTRMVIWFFELFTSDWFLTWIERENLQPFILPTKFLQDFHSLLPHNKFLLDVLFKHLREKFAHIWSAVEFCMYLDPPYFMDYHGPLDREFIKTSITGRHCIDWKYDPLPKTSSNTDVNGDEVESRSEDVDSSMSKFDASKQNVPMYDTERQHQFLLYGYDYAVPKEEMEHDGGSAEHTDGTSPYGIDAEDADDDHGSTSLLTTPHETAQKPHHSLSANEVAQSDAAAVEATFETAPEQNAADAFRDSSLGEVMLDDEERAFYAGADPPHLLSMSTTSGTREPPRQRPGSSPIEPSNNGGTTFRKRKRKRLKFLSAAVTTIQEVGYPSFVVQRAHDGISTPEALARFRELVWAECGIINQDSHHVQDPTSKRELQPDSTRRSAPDQNLEKGMPRRTSSSKLLVLFMEKDGNNRQITNLQEILQRFQLQYKEFRTQIEFQRVKMTSKTPCEQMRLMHRAFIVIAMHGADIVNTIFMRPGNKSYMIEISLGEGAAVAATGAEKDEVGEQKRGSLRNVEPEDRADINSVEKQEKKSQDHWRCDALKGMMWQEMEPWVFRTADSSISLSWDRTQNSYAHHEVLRRRRLYPDRYKEIHCKRLGNDTIATYYSAGDEKNLDPYLATGRAEGSQETGVPISTTRAAAQRQVPTTSPTSSSPHYDRLPSRRSMGYYSDFLRKAGVTYDNLQIGVPDLPLDNPYDDFGEERFRGVHLTEEFSKRLALGRDRNLTVPYSVLESLVRPKIQYGLKHFVV
ncbi:unnamed protein product [Amoebophrya sp. A120]|nr:unnamed protein product [Amoebophrya sp. A120]|eukprot:GSA120T00004345001.1